MVLPEDERAALWSEIMRQASSRRDELPLTKEELRAAVDAIDDWVDGNILSFNAAIPEPARSALLTKQKVQLLLFVVKRRWEVS